MADGGLYRTINDFRKGQGFEPIGDAVARLIARMAEESRREAERATGRKPEAT